MFVDEDKIILKNTLRLTSLQAKWMISYSTKAKKVSKSSILQLAKIDLVVKFIPGQTVSWDFLILRFYFM